MLVGLPFVFLALSREEDLAFMEGLYAQYHRLMYAQALRITHSSAAAEDAVSDSLMALMKKIDLLRTFPWNKLRAYVVITVKHTALTQLSSRKRERIDENAAVEDIAGGRPIDECLLAQAGIEGVKAAIRTLPDRERDVLTMKFFLGMTDEEIAGHWGLRPVSVRVILNRARKRLAERLKREEGWP